MKIFLDLETIPDQTPGALAAIRVATKPPGNITKAESIQKWMDENAGTAADTAWRKTALNGTSGEIVVIGFAFGENGDVETLHRSPGDPEAGLIRDFWLAVAMALEGHHGPHGGVEFVGHNLINFDARFIRQRSIIHGIRPSVKLDPGARHNGGHLFDTMQEWAGFKEYITLDALCKALGIESPKADGMDGSKVYDAWIAGRAEEIAAYCKKDVEQMREVWRRLTFHVAEAA